MAPLPILVIVSAFARLALCGLINTGPILTGPIKIDPNLFNRLPDYLKQLPPDLIQKIPVDVATLFPLDGSKITAELVRKLPIDVAAKINPGIFNLNKNMTAVTISDQGDRRDVTYWTTPDGTAIVDGDIAYGSEAELLAARSGAAKRGLEERSFFMGLKWTGGVINYRYYDAATAAKLQPHVDEAIRRWRSGAPFLQFNRLPDGNKGGFGILNIVGVDCGGCWSHVGMRLMGNIMNLQQPSTKCPGWCYADEATHEFGHLLGESCTPT